jgi:hypothetical protein
VSSGEKANMKRKLLVLLFTAIPMLMPNWVFAVAIDLDYKFIINPWCWN